MRVGVYRITKVHVRLDAARTQQGVYELRSSDRAVSAIYRGIPRYPLSSWREDQLE